MNEWIKLTEKKPECGQQCLIFVNDMNGRYHGFHIGRYILEYDYHMDVTFEGFDCTVIDASDEWEEWNEHKYRSEREDFNKYITHWMPLPEKPKED